MRRMLLVSCVVVLLVGVAVVAITSAPGGPQEQRRAEVPSRPTGGSVGGPFALAESGVTEASDDEQAAQASRFSGGGSGADTNYRYRYRRSRTEIMGEVADRLGVTRPRMWRALADVRRQISPRGWSDARDEALTLLAVELDRSPRRVREVVQDELADHYHDHHEDRNR